MSRKLPTNQGEILYPAIGGVTPSAPPPSYEDVVEQVNNVNPGVGPQYIYPQPPIIGVSSPCGERYCPRGQIYIVDQHCGINGNSHCIESERRCAIRRKRRIIMSVFASVILIIIAIVTTIIIVVNNQREDNVFVTSDCC